MVSLRWDEPRFFLKADGSQLEEGVNRVWREPTTSGDKLVALQDYSTTAREHGWDGVGGGDCAEQESKARQGRATETRGQPKKDR